MERHRAGRSWGEPAPSSKCRTAGDGFRPNCSSAISARRRRWSAPWP